MCLCRARLCHAEVTSPRTAAGLKVRALIASVKIGNALKDSEIGQKTLLHAGPAVSQQYAARSAVELLGLESVEGSMTKAALRAHALNAP